MARKKSSTPKTVPELSRAERIQHEKDELVRYINVETIGTPERHYSVGQQVVFGNWQKSIVLECFLNGNAYVLENETIEDRHNQKIVKNGITAVWWFDIFSSRKAGEAELFEPYRRGQARNGPLESILFEYARDGIVCDPTYQRGYVWTPFDREQLLTSVFERLEIGSFLFLRKHGYRHKAEDGAISYNTLHGETITIPKTKDFTLTVVDGQQRLTTLINFYLDKFSYKGRFFSELTAQDQHYFTNFTIQYRIIEEGEITRKELLKLFLQTNRGVPQSPEHIAKVQKLYEEEKE